MRSDGDVCCIIVISQIFHSFLGGDVVVQLDLNAGRKNGVDIPLESLTGKSVAGYSVSQHTAQLSSLLKYSGLVSHDGEIICSSESGGASSDNGYLLTCIIHFRRYGHAVTAVVNCISLHSPYIDRSVHQASSASHFAGMLADKSAYRWERIVFSYE